MGAVGAVTVLDYLYFPLLFWTGFDLWFMMIIGGFLSIGAGLIRYENEDGQTQDSED